MNLEIVWFTLAALAFGVYVALDGFDLGVGIVSRRLASTREERALLLRSIGPVWDGNEVWLLFAGGTLYFAFPKLYAVAIAGFYLPVTFLVWLLLFRALGIEMKHQFSHPLWDDAWDAIFFASSALLALFLGVALGNVIRGVSLDATGRFFAPLWTDFRVGTSVGILDWYTVLVGLTAVAVLALHGTLWICSRVDGPPRDRATRLAAPLFAVVASLFLAASVGTWIVRPDLTQGSSLVVALRVGLPALAVALFGAAFASVRTGAARRAFRLSSCGLVSLVLSVGAALYPYVLVSRSTPGLLASDARSSDYALTVAFTWWIPGVLLAAAYFAFLYRRLPDRVSLADHVDHDAH